MKKKKMDQSRKTKSYLFSSKGITLIALVITIIVLLILAGVTLHITIGEQGIFKTAKQAKEEYQLADIRERVEIALLDLDQEKVIHGETLTLEQALVGVKEKQIFEEIDLAEKIGICDGYLIELGYNENGKVVILGIEKDIGVRIKVSLTPEGYTNGNVQASIEVKTNGETITNLEIPKEMRKVEEGKYQIDQNGTYIITATLSNGETIEKEIKIATIDRLAPKEFTPKVEVVNGEIRIQEQAQDEADEESVASGIDHYEYYVNEKKYESQPIQNLPSGMYQVYVIAYDKAGNSRKSQEVEVEVAKILKIKTATAQYVQSLAIDEDGSLWVWGQNSGEELGIGMASHRPYKMREEIKFSQISTHVGHSLAIDEDGNLWTWGKNHSGKLGIVGINESKVPRKIELSTKFTQISIGFNHSLAMDEDGNLWAWGSKTYGAVGNGKQSIDQIIPVQIKRGTKFKQVSAGTFHSLAIDENGNLWGWGRNEDGQLGNEVTVGRQYVPVQIQKGTKFKEVSTGYAHSLAIDENGHLWTWGKNNHGQLGDGTNEDKKQLVPIKQEIKFSHISVGSYHNLAIDENGHLWTWGKNNHGQLGDGTKISSTIPVQIQVETKFKQIFAGENHSLAIDENDHLWTWGYDRLTNDSLVPVKVKF